MNIRTPLYAAVLVLLLLLAGCSARPPAQAVPLAPQGSSPALQTLYSQLGRWHGTPYRFGGEDRHGIDCSALVQQVLAEGFAIAVPRTTAQQQHLGVAVKQSALKAGDLVFFKPQGKGRHVGIYLNNGRFMHASTRAGVTVSSLHSEWWQRAYWQSRRLAAFE